MKMVKLKFNFKLNALFVLGVSLIILLFNQNCSKPVSQSSELPVNQLSAQEINQQKALMVLTTKCSSCHNKDLPSGGVDVLSIDQLLASGAVIPNEPALSPLFNAISSGAMPPSKALGQEDIQAVSTWISSMNKDTAVVLPPDQPVALAANFNSINRNILTPKCLGCHNSANSAGGVSYSTYNSAMNTVQRTLPMNSSLYTSVAIRNTMPKNAPGSLTALEKQVIFDWITAGANNN